MQTVALNFIEQKDVGMSNFLREKFEELQQSKREHAEHIRVMAVRLREICGEINECRSEPHRFAAQMWSDRVMNVYIERAEYFRVTIEDDGTRICSSADGRDVVEDDADLADILLTRLYDLMDE